MGRCIFCLRQGVEFNREHIIPKGFGRFGGKTPIFTKADEIVCKECNQTFGDDIDRRLCRQTVEGLKRIQKQGRELELRRDYLSQVKFYIKLGVRPPVDAYIEPLDYLQKKEINLLAQARLVKIDGKPLYIFDLGELKTLDPNNFKKKGWHIFTPSRKLGAVWENALIKLGFDAARQTIIEPLSSPESRLTVVYSHVAIGAEVLRAIAKIGFEFLIYKSRIERHFDRLDIYSDKFAVIRDFIKGKKIPENLTEIFEFGKPLLAQESERVTINSDGIIVMASIKGGVATASVRIHELFSYTIILSRNLNPTLTYASGMFFKPGEEAEELYARKTNLLVCVADLDKFGRPYFRQV
jgi:hypothetical protein